MVGGNQHEYEHMHFDNDDGPAGPNGELVSQRTFDPGDPDEVVFEVVDAVADVVAVDPNEIRERLWDRLDPDALSRLFAATTSGVRETGSYVAFEFVEYLVVVRDVGRVLVFHAATDA